MEHWLCAKHFLDFADTFSFKWLTKVSLYNIRDLKHQRIMLEFEGIGEVKPNGAIQGRLKRFSVSTGCKNKVPSSVELDDSP